MIEVSIIIPTYKDWDRLSICLKALEEQSYSAEAFEIIVVNNDPTDTPPPGFDIPVNCTILDEAKPGSYSARNAALRIVQGKFIGFTDSDCIPDKYWIENAVGLFDERADVMRIGGPLKIFFKAKTPTFVELYDHRFAFPQKGYISDGFSVTGNLFVRMEVVQKIGFFDGSLFSGGDRMWGLRANEEGMKIIYAEGVLVNHPARSSFKELYKKAKRIGKGQAVYSPVYGDRLTIAINFLRLLKPKKSFISFILKGSTIKLNFFQKIWLVFMSYFLIIIRYYYQVKYSRRYVSKVENCQ